MEIAKLIEKVPQSENAFQVEISKFKSQSAIISIPEKGGIVIPIETSPKVLSNVLIEAGINTNSDQVTRINLLRKEKSYIFTMDDLLSSNVNLILQPNDRITVEILPYKNDKVFILGGLIHKFLKLILPIAKH